MSLELEDKRKESTLILPTEEIEAEEEVEEPEAEVEEVEADS